MTLYQATFKLIRAIEEIKMDFWCFIEELLALWHYLFGREEK